jgi:hypothetical protein
MSEDKSRKECPECGASEFCEGLEYGSGNVDKCLNCGVRFEY